MAVQNFVCTYEELMRFLESYRERLFYVALNVEPPPPGARSFDITTFTDEDASAVIRAIHRGVELPRITPEAQRRIDLADLSTINFSAGVNIDPLNPAANPTAQDVKRAKWVRFPFVSQLYQRTLTDAFAFYDGIINAFDSEGVNVLLVLNHQTYGEGEGYYWPGMDSGKWAAFTPHFVSTVEQIVQHYQNKVAAYEIWNEGDVPNNAASVYIPASDFAPLLKCCSEVVRRHAPRSKALFGGLVGGSGISSRYVRDTRAALNGILPVDGIGLHPYGLGAPDDDTLFSRFGDIQWMLDAVREAAPNIPLWLTEVGALGSHDPQYWPDAAAYMKNLADYLRPQAHKVPVMIWFGWSDAMDFASKTNGLVTVNGEHKSPIYETFFDDVCQD